MSWICDPNGHTKFVATFVFKLDTTVLDAKTFSKPNGFDCKLPADSERVTYALMIGDASEERKNWPSDFFFKVWK